MKQNVVIRRVIPWKKVGIAILFLAWTTLLPSATMAAGFISGTVYDVSDAQNPVPLRDVSVAFFTGPCTKGLMGGVKTDANGFYTTEGSSIDFTNSPVYVLVAAGESGYDITNVWYSSAADPTGTTDCTQALLVDASSESVGNINFEVSGPGAIVTGVVRDAQGAPIENMKVMAFSNACNTDTYISAATTDANGVYTILGLPGGDVFVCTFAHFNDLEYSDECYTNSGGDGKCTDADPLTVTKGQTLSSIDFDLTTRVYTLPASPEHYTFEGMWPTLQQPWYFSWVWGLAKDSRGHIYVADHKGSRICVLDSDGHFIDSWNMYEVDNRGLRGPMGIAIDKDDNVYITDFNEYITSSNNHRVFKVDRNGKLIAIWGGQGNGPGEFQSPHGVALDPDGNVYVADKLNHRIQKFDANGAFIKQFGGYGSGDGEFKYPAYLAFDSQGNLFVGEDAQYASDHLAVSGINHRIQKFDSNDAFVTKWGTQGNEDGQFYQPRAVFVNGNDEVCVWDCNNIKKFTNDGQFISNQLVEALNRTTFSIALSTYFDKDGYIYTGDANEVLKLNHNGDFVSIWGPDNSADGRYSQPSFIAVDAQNNTYVTYGGNRIVKYNSQNEIVREWTDWDYYGGITGITVGDDGSIFLTMKEEGTNYYMTRIAPDESVTSWGSAGSGDGEFNFPWEAGMDFDQNGNILVADQGNFRIQKFDSNGVFLGQWGDGGYMDGQLSMVTDVAVDSQGDVWVADIGNNRVQKFTSNGQFIMKLYGWLGDECLLNGAATIAVDDQDNLYVANTWGHQLYILKFNSQGDLLAAFGEYGTGPGQFKDLRIDVSADGNKIFVVDSLNSRRQVFSKLNISNNAKAIIVAGKRDDNDALWDASQMNVNFAFRALGYQGFTKDSIYYLSSNTDVDIDQNGEPDVDADATNTNLQTALTSWAADADDVVVYMVDHGGDGTFSLQPGQLLSAENVAAWLDTLQAAIPGKLIIIIDACQSGSFLPWLGGAADRIVIASSSASQSAYFIQDGSVSFSNFFWTHIFNGLNVKDAFDLARQAMDESTTELFPQHAQLDDNGNGLGNEPGDGALAGATNIGIGSVVPGEGPVIGTVSPGQTIDGVNSALIYAEGVTDEDGIAHVWAVIRPPDYGQGGTSNPVISLPSVDLRSVGGDRYEITYEQFNTVGTYYIAIYARDYFGNTSVPNVTTVSVNNPLCRKVVLVLSGQASDPLWPAVRQNGQLAYDSLKFQGYHDDDITFYSPVSFSPGVDGSPTLDNIHQALTDAATNTQDVVLYMIGNGSDQGFEVNISETLSANQLDQWLDTLQASLPGKVTVIYDACRSAGLLGALSTPTDKERILIASAAPGEPAQFMSGGSISFSNFFWDKVANGADLRSAFLHGRQSMAYYFDYLDNSVGPQLDDNGDSLYSKLDGDLARYHHLGVGIMLAGNAPVISSISEGQTISDNSWAAVNVGGVTTTGRISQVWGVVYPPGYTPDASTPVTDLDTFFLYQEGLDLKGNGDYSGLYDAFSTTGTYTIAVYAMDEDGEVSSPQITHVVQGTSGGGLPPDDYELDDLVGQAKVINVNDQTAQSHNFHVEGDTDWIKFYGLSGEVFTIRVENLEEDCDPALYLYDTDGSTILRGEVDDGGPGEVEAISWNCPADGIYYIKVEDASLVFGTHNGYELKVFTPVGPFPGWVTGTVTNIVTGSIVSGAIIKIGTSGSAISQLDGLYLAGLAANSYTLIATASGYEPYSDSVEVFEGDVATHDVALVPAGCQLETYFRDADGDGFGDPSNSQPACSQPTGYVTDQTDCDDADSLEYPGQTWYKDTDQDGYSDGSSAVSCERPTDHYAELQLTAVSGDCEDDDEAVNPGASEICNGQDENCNGQVDEGLTVTFYLDADGDGHGNLAVSQEGCVQPDGYVADSTDCDDGCSDVHPGAKEICNGRDDDCDFVVDDGCIHRGVPCLMLLLDNDEAPDAGATSLFQE